MHKWLPSVLFVPKWAVAKNKHYLLWYGLTMTDPNEGRRNSWPQVGGKWGEELWVQLWRDKELGVCVLLIARKKQKGKRRENRIEYRPGKKHTANIKASENSTEKVRWKYCWKYDNKNYTWKSKQKDIRPATTGAREAGNDCCHLFCACASLLLSMGWKKHINRRIPFNAFSCNSATTAML